MKTAIEQAAARVRSNAVTQESARETEAATIIALQAEVMALQDKVVELIPYKARCEMIDDMPEPEPHVCTECAVASAKLALCEAECAAMKTELEKHKQMHMAEMQKRQAAEVVCAEANARLAADREWASRPVVVPPVVEQVQQLQTEWEFRIQRDGANQMIGVTATPRSE